MVGYTAPIYTKGTNQYKDFDFSFNVSPFSGDLLKKVDAEAIKQSIKNILFTMFGEKAFNPLFGGNLHKLLFEPLDPLIINQVQSGITQTIYNWEPRVNLLDIQVRQGSEEHSISITIVFKISNETTPQRLNVIIKRSR